MSCRWRRDVSVVSVSVSVMYRSWFGVARLMSRWCLVMSRSCFGFVTVVSQRCFRDVSVMSRCCFGSQWCLGDVLVVFPGGLGFVKVGPRFTVMSWWCFWWCFGYVFLSFMDVSVIAGKCFSVTKESRCFRHVLLMFWWSLSDVLVMSRRVSVMSWWCVVMRLWCFGDGVVMFWWWRLMNMFRRSVGSEAKRVAFRCVFAIGVVCCAIFLKIEKLIWDSPVSLWTRCELQGLCHVVQTVTSMISHPFGSGHTAIS